MQQLILVNMLKTKLLFLLTHEFVLILSNQCIYLKHLLLSKIYYYYDYRFFADYSE